MRRGWGIGGGPLKFRPAYKVFQEDLFTVLKCKKQNKNKKNPKTQRQRFKMKAAQNNIYIIHIKTVRQKFHIRNADIIQILFFGGGKGGPCCMARGALSSLTRDLTLYHSALETQSLNCWTDREAPRLTNFDFLTSFLYRQSASKSRVRKIFTI